MATSTLNPKTSIFVLSAYHAMEDFSDQWWPMGPRPLLSLVPDYWLRKSVEVVETASRDGDSKVRPKGAKDHECEGEPQADSAVAIWPIQQSRPRTNFLSASLPS
nr:protein EARLY RESPONSIVE TO DEHYDRATION 15-like [Ipomoea trifida]